ncbi:MAG: flagellar basal-body MS-ring/collar protein FliF [Alphaproteobacteria bacterium]
MQGLINTLRSLGPGRIIALGLVAAGLIGLFAYIISRFSATEMTPLFAGLEPGDSTAIVGELDSRGVDYQLTNGGTTIMVPSTEVARLRLDMAANGLPGYGVIGYEIFDNLDALGTTSNIIEINQQRAIEGELARTIRWLDSVQNARVHLVLPQRMTFSRETQPPSASIILDIRGGRTISADQVMAIQNLVASAVNRMEPDNVSVIDQGGRLLSQSTQTSRSEQLQTAYEAELEHRIVELLSAYVGAGHVQAKVTASMNFDLVTQSSTSYDPEGVVPAEVTTVERTRESTDQRGGDGVTVLAELPNPQDGAVDGTTSFSSDSSLEERVANRLSVVETQTTFAPGAVRRLSIAVMIDGSYDPTVVTDADGNEVSTISYRPRSQEELAAMQALVESAVGYDPARGDTLEVQNLQFAQGMSLAEMQVGSGVEVPGMLEEFGIDLTRLIEILLLVVLALVAIIFVVRPIMRGMSGAGGAVPALAGAAGNPAIAATMGADGQPLLTGPAGSEGEAEDDGRPKAPSRTAMDDFIDLAKIEGQVRRSSINKVSEIIDNHPQEAVALLRSWLYTEEGQN